MKYAKPVAMTAVALSMIAQPIPAASHAQTFMDEEIIAEAVATSSSEGGILVPLLFILILALVLSDSSTPCFECG
ncbi:MAG: hypothetical protein ACC631_12250 [Halocynthiibacter sp.]